MINGEFPIYTDFKTNNGTFAIIQASEQFGACIIAEAINQLVITMKKELKEQIERQGCKFDSYWKSIYNIERKEVIEHILTKNGYEIDEPKSGEHNITYKTTPQLYKNIVEKYDMTDFFKVIECLAELQQTQECGLGASGEEYHISDNKCGFHICVNMAQHKVKTLHFGDERTITKYHGGEIYIDEIKCDKVEKLLLEAIWKFEQQGEEIRLFPSDKASKKIVEYRKLLKKWIRFHSIINQDEWDFNELTFGIQGSIERDIEYWEEYIQKETAKLII